MIGLKHQIDINSAKKVVLYPEICQVKIFWSPIVERVSEYIFFISKKPQTHKQAKETEEKRRKETKYENEKENVVAVNIICGKSNGMR